MKHESLKGQVGNWVSGEDFWNREDEVARLSQYILDGTHVMLVAPRRVGKTSLMHEVANRLSEEYYSVFVDVENCQSPEDAIVEISQQTRAESSLWQRTREAFRDVFASLKANVDSMEAADLTLKFRDGVMGRWQHRGDQLLESLAKADKPVALFIDELPILVNRILQGTEGKITAERRQRAEIFLSWLRAASQAHQGNLNFVVSGSIGFGPVLGRANLSATMNHFAVFHLDAWSASTAQECLRALAAHRQLEFTAEGEREVTQLLGWCIPHHVQAMFDLLYIDARKANRTTIDPFDVKRVYTKQMLSIRGHSELKHYEERLEMVLDRELYPLACDMLTEAAVTPQGLSDDNAMLLWREHRGGSHDASREIRTVIDILMHDGYLNRKDGRLVFTSKLLRDWWKARFEAFFTPVADRAGRAK
jgi:uncharacterized protein